MLLKDHLTLNQKKKKLVVLTGAGISAESGLKTFRDSDGLWEGYNVADVATYEAWKKNPQLVLEFYNVRRRDVAAAEPNAAHFGLAELEKNFDVTIITQNIDDLHERAASTRVLHLHGEIFKMRSDWDPEKIFEIREDILLGDQSPEGGQLRPHIVWFGEAVTKIEEAIPIVFNAEILVVAGTSLVVYPAAGLLDYAAVQIPKFIIDKSIPYTTQLKNLISIEKKATEGIKDLLKYLQEYV